MFGGDGIDTLLGAAGNDTLNGGPGGDSLDGGADNDTVQGFDGNDTLLGGIGNDMISGGAQDDALAGGEGDDTLNGGSGVDTIVGGLGSDRLWGGDGADTFVFAGIAESPAGAARDIIGDFSHAQGDRIDLSAIDADAGLPGSQDFVFTGSAPNGQAGDLWFTGHVLSGDVTGDGVADFQIVLIGVSVFDPGDLLL
jgi:Ca2+-binding RTX toxin-like protein